MIRHRAVDQTAYAGQEYPLLFAVKLANPGMLLPMKLRSIIHETLVRLPPMQAATFHMDEKKGPCQPAPANKQSAAVEGDVSNRSYNRQVEFLTGPAYPCPYASSPACRPRQQRNTGATSHCRTETWP